MISRDKFSSKRTEEQLDVMVRWVLHSSLAEADPPSHAWDQIRGCVRKQKIRGGFYQDWRRFREFLDALLKKDLFFPPQRNYCFEGGMKNTMEQHSPYLFVCQLELPMVWAKVV
jgi:hypothetical protein